MPRTSGTQKNETTAKEKRKPARRDPEKRRQQNIQAQRKYREKLRERLDRLEALAASAVESRAAEKASKSKSGPSETAIASSNSSGDDTLARTPPPYTATGSVPTDISTTLGQSQQFDPQLTSSFDLSLWDTDAYLPALNDDSNFNLWGPAPPLPDDLTRPWPADPQTDTTLSEDYIWGSEPQYSTSYPSVQGLLDSSPSSIMSPSIGKYNRPDFCWSTTLNCSCSRPHFQIQSSGPNALGGPYKVIFLGPGVPKADPYANNLRIDQLCTLTALFTVISHVGLKDDDVCADEALSPFYHPSKETADIVAVQRTFKFLKPDMRPTKEQVTTSHHPMFDIFPFPSARNNLIKHQGEYDEDEFFHDSLSGLVCWGSGGVSQKDRNSFTGKISTGTPWDSRSWEAHVWYLRKYWDLLGGEEGELSRQTEWWRAMRGDDELDVLSI
ncbi:hypothetical protein BDV18DRAFT_144440 [Aspergillus unguis]